MKPVQRTFEDHDLKATIYSSAGGAEWLSGLCLSASVPPPKQNPSEVLDGRVYMPE